MALDDTQRRSRETRPRKAWLFAAHAGSGDPIGIDKDVGDLTRLFERELDAAYRAEVEVVRSAAGTLTSDVIVKALEDIDAFDGDRIVWFGAHGIRRTLGTTFLVTDDRHTAGHITIEALWRHLGHLARRGDGFLLAILDVCHAAVPAGSPLIQQLETSLVGIAATQVNQTARGTPTEGGWLTQRVISGLRAPANPPADGLVTVGSLIDGIARDQRAENRGGQTPFLVGQMTHTATVLNRLAVRSAPKADTQPLDAWRQHCVRRHTRLNMLFDGDDDRERVYVELGLAREQREKGRRNDMHAGRKPGRLTLSRLMTMASDRDVPRWRILGEPGAGKSTIARRLAAIQSRGAGQPVTVYLTLAKLAASGEHPFDAAEAELKAAKGRRSALGLSEALHDAAAEGRVWLLLDGLDEVPSDAAAEMRSQIADWAHDLPQTAIAVLGRPYDERPLAGFEHARVQPLDRAQRADLLIGWLGETRAALVQHRLASRPRVRELAQNPLLLSLIALLTDAGKTVGDSRRALYEEAIAVLLEQPGRYGKAVELRNADAARRLLRAVSVALHQKGGEAWAASAVEAEIDAVVEVGEATDADHLAFGSARAFMTELRRCGGVFGPFGGVDGAWRFLHRSLREFLAAEHLAARPSRLQAVLAELEEGENPDHWGVVLGLTCALATDRREALELIRAASPELALWALPEAELAPAEGLAFFRGVVDWHDPARHGEALKRLAVSWGADSDGASTLWAEVGPEAPVERLAVVHYALDAMLPAVDDGEFFRRAGRPMPTPAGLVPIAGDTFVMGSPEDEEDRFDDEVQHPVTVSDFELGEIPVTRAEYAAFDPEHRCDGSDHHAVTEVSWYAARLYAAWRSCVLPTEAEWEFACRAGTQTRFWSGDSEGDLARVGWFGGNTRRGNRVQPVAQKPANALGLYDMHGNVYEWCADWFGPYEPADRQDPAGPPDGVNRVFRGGVAWDGARSCRSAFRYGGSPRSRGVFLGFRLARRPPST